MSPDPPQPLPDLVRVEGQQRSLVVRIALLIVALVCFVLAIIGWLVPVVTGIPFWIAGFLVLGMASRRAARWINRQEAKLPQRWRLLLRPKLRRELKQAGNDGAGGRDEPRAPAP
jgi:hypothetical protein